MAEKTATPPVAANDNHHDFYVYAWLRPCGTPFYVGKGKGNRDALHKTHNPFFMRIVAKLRSLREEPRVVRWQVGLSEDDAHRLERAYISLFGRRDIGTGVLANMTDGGEGCSGRTVTEFTRSKLSEKMRSPEIANILSDSLRRPEVAARRAAALKSTEVRIKIGESSRGRVHSDATRRKMSISQQIAYETRLAG
jgi:hypothetical protein